MEIKQNEPLAPYTTFKIGGPAKYFAEASNLEELKEALDFAKGKSLEPWIFGGGSNVLVSDQGFGGMAIRLNNSGIKTVWEDGQTVELEVAAGEVWDDFVKRAVEQNLWGVENLSHIPGKTGAIAVQNVGAYGQEASQVIGRVVAYDKEIGELVDFSNSDCQFSYRKSIFNHERKGRYAILYTTFNLSKKPAPNLSYRDLNKLFEGKNPGLWEIRKAVINIRNRKFPFPVEAVNGNAGSFFKNVVLTKKQFEDFRNVFGRAFKPEDVSRLDKKVFISETKNEVKVPAAFLLDVCEIKGVEFGGAAINPNQPLVVVNKTGKATATDVLGLVNKVKETVKQRLGIELATEPEFVGFV